MAFRDINGELAVVIGCGTNRLDSAKRESSVTRIQDKIRCFLEKD